MTAAQSLAQIWADLPEAVSLADGRTFALKAMGPEDREQLQGFAESLSADDMLALHSDITQAAVVDRWLTDIQMGRTLTILAQDGLVLAGLGSLYLGATSWSRHIGEIQVIVDPTHRGVHLGQRLSEAVLAVADQMGLARVVAQIPNDHPAVHGAFQRLGFESIALLPGFALGPGGEERDLLLMSHELPLARGSGGDGWLQLPWGRG
jgi:RimJ/RimL family protein N-acetyltransferase